MVGTPTEDCSSLTRKVMLLLWQKSSLFGVGKDMLNTSLIKNCGAGQVLTCTDVLTMYWKRGTTSLAKSLAVLQWHLQHLPSAMSPISKCACCLILLYWYWLPDQVKARTFLASNSPLVLILDFPWSWLAFTWCTQLKDHSGRSGRSSNTDILLKWAQK